MQTDLCLLILSEVKSHPQRVPTAAIPFIALIMVLSGFTSACSGGVVAVGPLRWPTGPNLAYVSTIAGIRPVNLVTGSVGRPLTGREYGFDAIVVVPGGHTAYISAPGGYVSVNLSTGRIGKPFPRGDQWDTMALAPDGSTLYLAGADSGTGKASHEIVPVSTSTGSIETPIPVPGSPVGVATSPGGETAYVITDMDATITPVNLSTRVSRPPIQISDGVNLLAFSPDGTTAYAVGATAIGPTGEHLFPINLTSDVVGTPLTLSIQAHGLVISPDGRTAYATDGYGVRSIDLATGRMTRTIRIASGAGPIAFAR